MSTAEKAKIRNWILKAAESDKGSKGVTIQAIKKFLDSKQEGLSMKPETKMMLKRLLETGHLERKEGKYGIKKSKKKPLGKVSKRSKSPMRNAGRSTDKKAKSTTGKAKSATGKAKSTSKKSSKLPKAMPVK